MVVVRGQLSAAYLVGQALGSYGAIRGAAVVGFASAGFPVVDDELPDAARSIESIIDEPSGVDAVFGAEEDLIELAAATVALVPATTVTSAPPTVGV